MKETRESVARESMSFEYIQRNKLSMNIKQRYHKFVKRRRGEGEGGCDCNGACQVTGGSDVACLNFHFRQECDEHTCQHIDCGNRFFQKWDKNNNNWDENVTIIEV